MSVTFAPPAAPAHQVNAALADPARIASIRGNHDDGLRKLRTAVQVAAGRGATWAEIVAAVEHAYAEQVNAGQDGARLAAIARAAAHHGDDSI